MNRILTITALIFSLTAIAQKTDSSIGSQVVNVVGTYTPTISDAFKVKETPSFEQETVSEKQPINYSITSYPVASTFVPEKGKAASVEKGKKDKFFNNYASLGFGNYGTLLGELYLTHNFDQNRYLGAFIKHHSSQGGIKDVVLDDFFYDTSIDLTYSEQQKTYAWSGDVGFQNQVYNWYGLPLELFDQETIKTIDEQQTYNSFYLGGKLSVNEGIFNGAEIFYRHFSDVQESKENRFWVKPSFDVEIAQTKVKVDVVADYVGSAFAKDYTATIENIEYSYFNLGIQPSFIYQKDDLAVKAGVGIFYSMGKFSNETDNKLFVYPQVQASYKVVGDLMIAYTGLEGTLQQNSYFDFISENPFLAPNQIIAPTEKPYDFYVGLKGKLANNIAYNIRGSYSNEKGKALYSSGYVQINPNTEGYTFGNSMFVLYDDIKTVGFFGELKADLTKTISVNLSGNFNSYSTDNQEEAWHLPNIRFSAGAEAAITPKLSLNANVFYVGERKAKFTTYDQLYGSFMEADIVTLDGYVDVNLGINYKYNERLSLFLKAHNLADKQYDKWLNYPVQGIQILGGASYKFDF
ncbi:MAG: TonB-dependent receptor [Flavobacteriaceae bacterium]